MKIDKWVEFSKEIEIELSTEDIYLILEEGADSLTVILRCLNSVAKFLKGVPDSKISEFTDGQRSMIRDFLSEQSKRWEQP